MGRSSGVLRNRKVTPIRDYAARKSNTALPGTMRTRPRMNGSFRRPTVFSLAVRFIKLFGYLFLTLLLVLLALNFQVVHEGGGSFKIRAKETWAFTGTFVGSPTATARGAATTTARVTTPNPSSPAASQASPAVPLMGHLEQSMTECGRMRTILDQAVYRYNRQQPNAPMRKLDIFGLLSSGLIKELPNCPAGGEYELRRGSDGRMHCACSRHAE